jgi:putative ABC transport system permease protein
VYDSIWDESMHRLIPLIVRNLFRNARRTILTVLSIAVSIFIFAGLMSLPNLVNQILRDRANTLRLVGYNKGGYFSNTLPYAYSGRIQSISHVENVIGESIFLSTYRTPGEQVAALAADPEHFAEVFPDWGISAAGEEEFARVRTAALVGRTLANRFRWRIGDQIILHGINQPVDLPLNIVGTMDGTTASFVVLFRRDYLDETLGRPGTVNIFWAKVDKSSSIPAVISDIDGTFANAPFETKTESELAVSENRVGQMRVILDGAKILAAIVIVAIGLVAANTAAMSVRERRRELAVMRSMGFTRETVIALMVVEGLAIGLLGGILGCGGAYFGLKLLPYASKSIGLLAYAISLPNRNIASGVIIAAIIGIVSTLVPALSATRGDISDELRAI